MPGECVYKLVLLRHESEWNKANKFTGWTDVGLSEVGVEEAHAAAEMLKEVESFLLPRPRNVAGATAQ
ncbi:MAG: hypothetical protein MHM6MM_009579 [Cercozoa sp. M6MM]